VVDEDIYEVMRQLAIDQLVNEAIVPHPIKSFVDI
ncbi:hypothetical protein AVEN_17246-1, partial [Araneus ventricosus]